MELTRQSSYGCVFALFPHCSQLSSSSRPLAHTQLGKKQHELCPVLQQRCCLAWQLLPNKGVQYVSYISLPVQYRVSLLQVTKGFLYWLQGKSVASFTIQNYPFLSQIGPVQFASTNKTIKKMKVTERAGWRTGSYHTQRRAAWDTLWFHVRTQCTQQ